MAILISQAPINKDVKRKEIVVKIPKGYTLEYIRLEDNNTTVVLELIKTKKYGN